MMTEAEQWDQINYPSFFGAICEKIVAAKHAMSAIPATTYAGDGGMTWLETNVNNVPIRWRDVDGDYVAIRVGERDTDHQPICEFTIPTQWLAA
jgi:hypothetical protein